MANTFFFQRSSAQNSYQSQSAHFHHTSMTEMFFKLRLKKSLTLFFHKSFLQLFKLQSFKSSSFHGRYSYIFGIDIFSVSHSTSITASEKKTSVFLNIKFIIILS